MRISDWSSDVCSSDLANGQPQQVTVLGISSKGVEYKRYDPATALWHAVKETGNLTARTLEALGQMIVGQRDAAELGGPLRIAQMSGDFAKVGLEIGRAHV